MQEEAGPAVQDLEAAKETCPRTKSAPQRLQAKHDARVSHFNKLILTVVGTTEGGRQKGRWVPMEKSGQAGEDSKSRDKSGLSGGQRKGQ